MRKTSRRTLLKALGTAAMGTAAIGVVHAPASLEAQAIAPVFDRLAGDWHGEGTLMGRTAEFSMTWTRHEALTMLAFSNAFVDSAGEVTPVLSASAVYRSSDEMPEGVWLDSRGERIEITWRASDSSLVADWSSPTESGRTTYDVVAEDVVEVTDEVRIDEGWRTFATATYRRVPAGESRAGESKSRTSRPRTGPPRRARDA